jgi:hypothetical protein
MSFPDLQLSGESIEIVGETFGPRYYREQMFHVMMSMKRVDENMKAKA